MARILITTGHHLCRNPRVYKEARALARAGHEVEVHTPAFTEALLEEDRRLPGHDTFVHRIHADIRSKSSLSALAMRGVRRLAFERVRLLGTQSPAALGYAIARQRDMARAARADLVIGHQETGLWVACELHREGRPVGVDFEDWYSRDLLPEARATRPLGLIEDCERRAMHIAAHTTTTSRALAQGLVAAHGGRPPAVVYNSFPDLPAMQREIPPESCPDRPLRVIWFSQTIGPGRGIELVLQAVSLCNRPVHLTLSGSIDARVREQYRGSFSSKVGARLEILDPVPFGELTRRIAGHDVGLALESANPESRDLTITNKILLCLGCGLPVIATPTRGQLEVAGLAGGAVYPVAFDDPSVLARTLEELSSDRRLLQSASARASVAYDSHFAWHLQEKTLVESVERALHRKGTGCGES